MKITMKKIGDVMIPATEADKENFKRFHDAAYEIDIKNIDLRTDAQNKALHVYLKQIADALNGAGFTMNVALNKSRDDRAIKVFKWAREKLKAFGLDSVIPMIDKMEDWILNREYDDHADVDWSLDTVKDIIWRKIQNVRVGKSSTTKLTRSEIDDVYNHVNKFLSNRFGIHVEFPSRELWNEVKKDGIHRNEG